jgi:hypothetical protein
MAHEAEPEARRLADFLIHLAKHPKLAKKFGHDPAFAAELMKAHDLTAEQVKLLKGNARETEAEHVKRINAHLEHAFHCTPGRGTLMAKMSVCFTKTNPGN